MQRGATADPRPAFVADPSLRASGRRYGAVSRKTTENISEQQPKIADDQDIIIIPTQTTFDFTEQEHQQDTGKGSTTQKPNDAASQDYSQIVLSFFFRSLQYLNNSSFTSPHKLTKN
ncbi:hypothetical protein ROHU_006272 [Labeo rohita]|uniref:Uncharacterized protein n=1 Tax=Labeo rohita TaxID=84645 RepID=A0A498N5N8_LABRO|nr:hypothetical protein ROHU_006272 [Labeo rohita]